MRQMPSFHEWGLRPAGLKGPRENPVATVALPVPKAALPQAMERIDENRRELNGLMLRC